MKTLHVKPAPGLQVRRGAYQFLAESGERVPDTPYWRRRLRDGDVLMVEPATKAKDSKPNTKTTPKPTSNDGDRS